MNELYRNRLSRVGGAYADVIRSRRYVPLWLGQLISNFGDTLHYIALVVLVFQLTGRGVAVAGLVAAEVIPVLLLGPIAGVIIDRFSRKRVIIAADLLRAALALSLVWPQGVWHPYLVAAGLSAGKPSITITSPSNGQTVTGSFALNVTVKNFRLSCNLYGKKNLTGWGHWHANHDSMNGPMMGMGTMLGMSCAHSFQVSTLGLKPGKHTFFAILEDNQHAPLMPSVFGKVTVNVK